MDCFIKTFCFYCALINFYNFLIEVKIIEIKFYFIATFDFYNLIWYNYLALLYCILKCVMVSNHEPQAPPVHALVQY